MKESETEDEYNGDNESDSSTSSSDKGIGSETEETEQIEDHDNIFMERYLKLVEELLEPADVISSGLRVIKGLLQDLPDSHEKRMFLKKLIDHTHDFYMKMEYGE